jgi:F-box-like
MLAEAADQETKVEVGSGITRGITGELQHLKGTYESLLSPLRRFPSELIVQILRYCLPGDHHGVMLDATHRKEFRTLRGVCRRWRDIAFSTSDFWRGIAVDGSSSEVVQILESWFERAGPQAPLRLELRNVTDPLSEDLTALLTNRQHRWIALTLGIKLSALHTLLTIVRSMSEIRE